MRHREHVVNLSEVPNEIWNGIAERERRIAELIVAHASKADVTASIQGNWPSGNFGVPSGPVEFSMRVDVPWLGRDDHDSANFYYSRNGHNLFHTAYTRHVTGVDEQQNPTETYDFRQVSFNPRVGFVLVGEQIVTTKAGEPVTTPSEKAVSPDIIVDLAQLVVGDAMRIDRLRLLRGNQS